VLWRKWRYVLIRTLGALLVLVLAVPGAGEAQQVELKKSFWKGWQYSVNGSEYETVGRSAKGLVSIAAGNESVLAELDAYKSRQTWANVFAIAGGGLLGFAIGSSFGDEGWQSTQTAMASVGGGLVVIGMVFDHSASGHLQRGVELYNGGLGSLEIGVEAWAVNLDRPRVDVGPVLGFSF
jgi:hypothetical protein